MKTQKLLFVIAVAAVLLIGASNARACCTEKFQGWVVLGSTSSSGISYVDSEVCMNAVEEIRLRGFRFMGISHVRENISVLYFQKVDDTVSLFCASVIGPLEIPGNPLL